MALNDQTLQVTLGRSPNVEERIVSGDLFLCAGRDDDASRDGERDEQLACGVLAGDVHDVDLQDHFQVYVRRDVFGAFLRTTRGFLYNPKSTSPERKEQPWPRSTYV